MQDVREAYRSLRHSPHYAAWVSGSLAIGMAVTIAALALLNAMLRLPFPGVSDQPHLVRIAVSRNCGRPDCWIRMSSDSDFRALAEGLRGLRGLAAYGQGDIVAALPEPRSMRAVIASADYFEVLGVRPAMGRAFGRGDEEGHAAVGVIADHVWTREYGRDPSVIGRTIRIGDHMVAIIGVAPPLFAGVDRIRPGGGAPEIWIPMWLADPGVPRGSSRASHGNGGIVPLTPAEQRRGERDLGFVGRLRDGVDPAQVLAEAQILAGQLAASRGESSERARGMADVRRVWRVDPKSWHFGVIVVMPIPILVLIIACVNAANLMLARGSERQREIAIRLAIGARRARIVRQLLVESAVLTCAAVAVAIPAAWWGLQAASGPIGTEIPFDPLVLSLTIVTGAFTALAFGLLPALRVSAHQPSSTLGSAGARSDAVAGQSRARRLLVIAQVALSLGLLATAWQLVGTVQAQAVSAGTPGDRLLIAYVDLQPLALAAHEADAFYAQLLHGATRLPGVDAAGLARRTSVWTFGQGAAPASLLVWRPGDGPLDGQAVNGGYVAGDLFDAVGLRVLEGRGFTDADRTERPQVAVVNETAAKKMTGPAVGGVIRVAPRDKNFASSIEVRVVGVIEPAVEPRYTPGEAPAAKLYLPSPIEPEPALALYLRTRGPAAETAPGVRQLVRRIDSRVPVSAIGSLDELNERSYGYGPQLWLARAAVVVGVLGLLLATAGLYGVSSYVVAMRSREMAIRIAVGATPRMILAMIVGQSMRMALIGLVAGTGAAVAASRYIQSEYHGIAGLDATAFIGSMVLFLAAMLLASTVPAARAARVDPVANLKRE